MASGYWITIVLGILLLGFVIHRFALTLREGELNVGVFFGKFQKLKRSESPVKFYFALMIRIVIFTLAILLALWILQKDILS